MNLSSRSLLLLLIHSLCFLENEARRLPTVDNLRRKAESVLENSNFMTIDRRRRLGKDIPTTGLVLPCKDVSRSSKQKQMFWPPWPFSLLDRTNVDSLHEYDGVVTASNTYPSAAALFWVYCKERTKIGIRQCKEIGATMYFHLPPALPPFVLFASIPRRVIIETEGEAVAQRVIPLISNQFARNLALGGLGLTIMSWSLSELQRKQKITPLLQNQSVSSVFLPPFLPEAVPEIDALESAQEAVKNNVEKANANGGADDNFLLSPKLRQHLHDLYEIAPHPRSFQSLWAEWKRRNRLRQREAAKVRRLTVFDELIALQAIKWNSARKRKLKEHTGTANAGESKNVGYALVTGASQGIGRAIAVELARWEVPLILVSRNIDSMVSLAYDLEACYGVKCCVLQADLSEIDAAEKIHQTTSDNGLVVDILVNNAGIGLGGLSVDLGTSEMERMIMLNTMTLSKLSCLYGQDMKSRKQGRILMISSMVGLASAAPYTALYGATKAFTKSFCLAMAKEMEKFGVGVTCLIPGAVKTNFGSQSGMEKCLCWYWPFYIRSPESVAHLGVTSLFDGDNQVIPGFQNRLFEKILKPILPLRIESMIIEAAFSPFSLPRIFPFPKEGQDTESDDQESFESSKVTGTYHDLKPRYKLQPAPRLLKLRVRDPMIIPKLEESIVTPDIETASDMETTSDIETEMTNDNEKNETLKHDDSNQVLISPELIKGGVHIKTIRKSSRNKIIDGDKKGDLRGTSQEVKRSNQIPKHAKTDVISTSLGPMDLIGQETVEWPSN